MVLGFSSLSSELVEAGGCEVEGGGGASSSSIGCTSTVGTMSNFSSSKAGFSLFIFNICTLLFVEMGLICMVISEIWLRTQQGPVHLG